MTSEKQAPPSMKFSFVVSCLIITIAVLVILIVSSIEFADAQQTIGKSHMIGISVSESCKISTTCSSIEELALALDNTNQFYSGFFGYDENGIYERQPSQFKKHWNFYTNPNQIIIAVDPSGDWIPRLDQHITIVPSHFTFFHAEDMKIESYYETVIENKTKQICADWRDAKCWEIVFFETQVKVEPVQTQRVDQSIRSCAKATIHYSALQDTINHFLSNCKEQQTGEYVINTILPQIPFEYKDSQWAKYAEWQKKAIANCKQKC